MKSKEQTSQPWKAGELSPDDRQTIDKMLDTRVVHDASQIITDALQEHQFESLTVLVPAMQNHFGNYGSDRLSTIASGAGMAGASVQESGLRDVFNGYTHGVGQFNKSPQDFRIEDVPQEMQPYLDPNRSMVGYMHVQQGEDGRAQTTIGCLDFATNTHYSLPFGQ